MVFETIIGILGSLVTIEEAAKKYIFERPDQAKRMELEDFRAYLSETNQNEILEKLDSVIGSLQEVKEIGSSSEFKIDMLLKYAEEAREFKQGRPIVEIVDPIITTGDYQMNGLMLMKVQPKLQFKIRNLGDAPLEKFSFQVETVSGFFSTHPSGLDIRRFFIGNENGKDFYCIDEKTTNRIEAGQGKNLFVGMTILDGQNFQEFSRSSIVVKVFAGVQKHEKSFRIDGKVNFQNEVLTIKRFWLKGIHLD